MPKLPKGFEEELKKKAAERGEQKPTSGTELTRRKSSVGGVEQLVDMFLTKVGIVNAKVRDVFLTAIKNLSKKLAITGTRSPEKALIEELKAKLKEGTAEDKAAIAKLENSPLLISFLKTVTGLMSKLPSMPRRGSTVEKAEPEISGPTQNSMAASRAKFLASQAASARLIDKTGDTLARKSYREGQLYDSRTERRVGPPPTEPKKRTPPKLPTPEEMAKMRAKHKSGPGGGKKG